MCGAVGVDAVARSGVDVVAEATEWVRSVPDASADGFILYDFLEHLMPAQVAAFLGQVCRSLRAGGRVWIRVPDTETIAGMFTGDIASLSRHLRGDVGDPNSFFLDVHKTFFTADTLSQLLALAGLEVVSLFRARGAHAGASGTNLLVAARKPGRLPGEGLGPGLLPSERSDRSDEPAERRGAGYLQVRWAASIFDFSGYSRQARDAILALDRRGVPVQAQPLAVSREFLKQLATSPQDLQIWERLVGNRVLGGAFICFHPPRLWNGCDVFAFYRQQNPGFDAYVGVCTFETDRLPAGWAEACNGMDEIWVPSTFNAETFARSGVDSHRLQVIPFGLDLRAYDPGAVRPLDIPGRRGFAFLSVFQWTKRKGWDVLLRAYLAAFTRRDDVCLVLRTYPGPTRTASIRERIDSFVRHLGYDPSSVPPIILLEDFIPEREMPALYAAADALVLPTRGEGWGIPFMEAMAMGLPVIGTRWSGHLDFMNDANSYLIDIEGLVPVDAEQTEENPFYTPDHRWAEPSVDETARLIRLVYEDRDAARAVGLRARQDIQERWSVERTADWMIERLSHLLGKDGADAAGERPVSVCPVRDIAWTPRHRVKETTRPPVHWHAPIFDPSGYGDEARNLVQRVVAQWPVRVQPAMRASGFFAAHMDPAERKLFEHLMRTPLGDRYICLVHTPAYAFRRDPGAVYNIGRTVFETDRLSEEWVIRCNLMDEIWVPTTFNVETFRASGVVAPLHVVPEGVDVGRFRPGLAPLPIEGRRRYAFLSVFEWTYRKGWDILLRAWAEAFCPDDDVCLILRTYPANATDAADAVAEINRRIETYLQRELGRFRSDVAPILVLGNQLPQADMPRLYAAADAYVMPSRGEGWGRPYIEAMACGLPVIGTRWSGNLDFMNDENSYLIDIEGLEEVDERMEFPFYRGHRWAAPSVGHLVDLMRRVHRRAEEARERGRRARQDVVERWSWENAARAVVSRLESVSSRVISVQDSTASASVAQDATPRNYPSSPRTARSIEEASCGPLAIRWEGSQFVHHSLALVNRELCLRLIQAGHELSIIPYEPDQFGPEADSRFHELAARCLAPFSRPADVHVRHQWPPNLNPPPEGHWVMIQPWEFGSLPKRWVEVMRSQVDEVWVPSTYVRDCCVRSGVPGDRVHVIPNGVDPRVFRPDAKPLRLPFCSEGGRPFTFLFVGGTIWRKGIDVLLKAYRKAFSPGDNVCLVIKDMGRRSFYRGRNWGDAICQLQAASDVPPIVYLDQDLLPGQMPGLYTACDCLVHPYRGEGFGLPIAEAMACGLPVIVTNHGAALDFCNAENAYLVPARVVYLPQRRIDNIETVDYPWVAEPDVDALAQLMRHVYEHPEEARRRGEEASRYVRTEFSWDKAAEKLLSRLETLRGRPIRRYEGGRSACEDDGEALSLVERRSVHFLMVPDFADPRDQWAVALREFLHEFGADEDVGLIIRMDPGEFPNQAAIVRRIREEALSGGFDLENTGHMILVLNDPVDARKRRSVYRTSQIFINTLVCDPAAGGRAEEARACGLLICEPRGDAMRSAFDAVRATVAAG